VNLNGQGKELNINTVNYRGTLPLMGIISKNKDNIKQFFFDYIYPDHNSRKIVKLKLRTLLSILDQPETTGLNIGSGSSKYHPRIMNLDVCPGENIDIVGTAEDIPCEDDFFDLIISQECLEHVKDPFKATKEIYRVLKKGGKLYVQLPFIIGYHPGPTDFWRFTVEGIEELTLRCNLKTLEKGIVVGGGTGYYRISVEFFAGLFSVPFNFLYKPFKLVFAFLLYPFKVADFLFKYSPQKDRIPGGYFIIVQK
jgi:SAM-dependent methyltransferase